MKRTNSEKIPIAIFPSFIEASKSVADEIAALIRDKTARNEMCVLGLATGSTPTTVYAELVRQHREEGLSFKRVITFNLDEYYPMPPESLQSYVRFMKEHLFDHIDIPEEHIHIPDGTVPKDAIDRYCENYEQQIAEAGGIDLQLLGIGRTGHIVFNEPGSGRDSRTRLITLDHITIMDAASDFFGEENVPKKAITMGIQTILRAKKVLMLAWGENKAPIIRAAVEEDVTDTIPATYLQVHSNVTAILDKASSAGLTRVRSPWLVSTAVNWDGQLVKKAVIQLSEATRKPILKLTNRDYADHGMIDLVTEHDSAYNINIRVFKELQNTITGHPAGKGAGPKTILIFSPHPDDDVISMGGTFLRLVDHGHEVHVAYQTSGNIAVYDEDVVRFVDFANDFNDTLQLKDNDIDALLTAVKREVSDKKPGAVDSDMIKKIKGLIRKGEAKAACRYVGIPEANAHFLDMPFYETGKVKKKPLNDADIQLIVDLFERLQPHQVYAAGDLSDPHGTHRVCL
ncbi:MAG: glucosamine-6-phosphate deaminase, partial [Sinomicrobium sp.]|nr:glucosamine-6-phosphate deaminase [Sinomicrobium sp.]